MCNPRLCAQPVLSIYAKLGATVTPKTPHHCCAPHHSNFCQQWLLFVEHYSSCSIRNMQSSAVLWDQWARAGGGCVVTGQLQLGGSSLARTSRRIATASSGRAQGKELPHPFLSEFQLELWRTQHPDSCSSAPMMSDSFSTRIAWLASGYWDSTSSTSGH